MKALRNPYVITEGKALKHAADIMLEIVKLDTKNGVLESGENIHGGAQQTGHKVRIKVKKNRLGSPARTAQFSYHYDQGIVDTATEIFELGKSLGVIYHPKSETTGKENNMMWAFGTYAPIKGEANMLEFVKGSRTVQDEIMTQCFSHKDAPVALGADGVVIEEDDLAGVDIDLS